MAYTTAATHGVKDVSLTDFLMRWAGPKRQTASEMLAAFRSLASRFDSKDPARVDHR